MASDNIFSTTNVWPNYSTSNVQKAASKKTDTLGKEQFLDILMKQLQNQDPLQPMDDKEFVAQLAQFSSVEQLINISSQLTAMSQSLGNVSGLIGKQISWMDEGDPSNGTIEKQTPEMKKGIVESIIVKDGVQYATVGELAIPLSKIIEIREVKPEETAPPAEDVPPVDDSPPTDGTDPVDQPDPEPGPDEDQTGGSGETK